MSFLTASEVSNPNFTFGPNRCLSTQSDLNLAVAKARAGNVAPLAALVESEGITIDQVPGDLKDMVNQYNARRGGRRRRKTRHRKSRRRHGRKTRRSRK